MRGFVSLKKKKKKKFREWGDLSLYNDQMLALTGAAPSLKMHSRWWSSRCWLTLMAEGVRGAQSIVVWLASVTFCSFHFLLTQASAGHRPQVRIRVAHTKPTWNGPIRVTLTSWGHMCIILISCKLWEPWNRSILLYRHYNCFSCLNTINMFK